MIELWHCDSIFTQPLSPACHLCAKGAKMVVLITGCCPAACFYCPLSLKKGGQDVIYADEWKLDSPEDTDILAKEANLIDAEGAGITGGDPLMVPERTNFFIEFLKRTYGPSFHIHLYTSGLVNSRKIPDLADVGLDEIRFHPMPDEWEFMNSSKIYRAIQSAIDTSMDVAIEIPVLPGMDKQIISLIHWADDHQINWVNLNELEFSERNEIQLRKRKMTEKHDISAAVNQSQETAYRIIENIDTKNLDVGVHYCSSSFKDAIQLKNRMRRRAENIKTNLDYITDDATILKGIIKHSNKDRIQSLLAQLIKTHGLTKKDYILNTPFTMQISISLLEKIAEDLVNKGFSCYISEQYPTQDQLEVERIPLPYKYDK